MRVADHFFGNGVAPVGVRIRATIAQCVIGDALDRNLEIALLLVKERTAVGYKILQIANLRPINRRIVDFGDNPIPNREPEMAGCRVCRADSILVAMRPTGLNAWFSKRLFKAMRVMTQGQSQNIENPNHDAW